MTAYVITYGANPSDRFTARSYSTRAEAWKASTNTPGVPEGEPAGGCGYVIERPEDITFGGSLLDEVYEELTGATYNEKLPRAHRIKLLMEALANVK